MIRERSERKNFFVHPTFPNVGGTSKQMSVLNTLKFDVWLSHYSGGSRHLRTRRPPPHYQFLRRLQYVSKLVNYCMSSLLRKKSREKGAIYRFQWVF